MLYSFNFKACATFSPDSNCSSYSDPIKLSIDLLFTPLYSVLRILSFFTWNTYRTRRLADLYAYSYLRYVWVEIICFGASHAYSMAILRRWWRSGVVSGVSYLTRPIWLPKDNSLAIEHFYLNVFHYVCESYDKNVLP